MLVQHKVKQWVPKSPRSMKAYLWLSFYLYFETYIQLKFVESMLPVSDLSIPKQIIPIALFSASLQLVCIPIILVRIDLLIDTHYRSETPVFCTESTTPYLPT